ISDPKNVTAKKFLSNVFPHRANYYAGVYNSNPDSVKVIVDWIRRDTVMDCEEYMHLYERYYAFSSADKAGNFAAPNVGGRGGSMARFTLMEQYLYAVSDYDLRTFNISSAQDPSLVTKTNIGWGIETIYPFKDKLFIGSTTGMFIYD